MIGISLFLATAVTVGENGFPIYDAAPLPAYVETALAPMRKVELASELPQRVEESERRLLSLTHQVKAAFKGSEESVQYVRISKRLEMAHRLCEYIRDECARGTVSGLCSAESGEACLQEFIRNFGRELEMWKRYPEAPGTRPRVFNVRDYGAKGDGATDDEPAFQAALACVRSLNGEPSILRIPQGKYLLLAKQTDNPRDRIRRVRFAKVENCIVSGDSAETTHLVLGDYDGDGIDFREWENGALRGVQLYWSESPFVEGEVESVDRMGGSLVLRHHEGTLKPDDSRFARIGHSNSCMQFSRDGTPIRKPVLWYDYRCENLGEGRYRMYFDREQGTTKTMPTEPGSILVFPDRDNRLAAFRADGSSFFTFDRVWVRNSRAGAFITDGALSPTIAGCRVFPKDPRFCLSTNADGNFTSPGTCIVGCDFTNMNDDGSNAHHVGQIFHSYDAATGEYEHESFWQWERPGDFAVVVSSLDGRYYANTRVKSVRAKPDDRRRQLTVFTDALPSEVRSYTSLGLAPYDPLARRRIYLGTMKTPRFPDQFYVPYGKGVGYVCSGNRFSNLRGVAVQVQTPNSLVESNKIVNVYRGIELSGLLQYQEGLPPYNVVVRGNCISNVNRGIKSSFMTLNHPPAVTTPMEKLVFEGNRVEQADECPLILANVQDALVKGNVFSGSCNVELDVCRRVRFVGNVRDGQSFCTPGTVRIAHCAEIELQEK